MVAQLVKNPPAMQETWVRFLGWGDPLEKGKAAGILQYSGLENSMDCIVPGVANSHTPLNDFHFHFKESTLQSLPEICCLVAKSSLIHCDAIAR